MGGGGGELRYEISQNAYIKLVLHSLKHKTSAVNGVFVGSSCDDVVQIIDSVPLFHNHLGLLPPLEISLIMIEEYYGARGLGIVGYFHANERSDDLELGNVAKNIGDHIYRYFPQAAILLLYTRDASKNWKLAGSDGGCQLTTKEPAANAVLLDYISSKKWEDVVDFDDHLDDITKDWLNPELFKVGPRHAYGPDEI
ncbi:PREDICTED: ER membrane protein complex subunit 8/9 homolog isoform X2 [Populus euphratica]|uniref:ER membrane protein complex subunit 8/9 homolog isoform X2 n=1 Tax=Populus euphratica TaxID=75702 RepID=A0AAJ6UZM1_POPEU|nr:PREDICTED: ER membrane protein complex subunit 8/9 homolog isoform X2 [Populus euphratica]